MPKNPTLNKVVKLTLILLLIGIIFTPFVIVNAGERVVVMQFGKVQEKVL
jgi:regulator of protease activity HflC (stomatin/prohibitin superfamily)